VCKHSEELRYAAERYKQQHFELSTRLFEDFDFFFNCIIFANMLQGS